MSIELSSILRTSFCEYRKKQMRVVGIGDSLAQNGNGLASGICANGGGAFSFAKSLGVGGQTSAQVLARVSEAIAYRPDLLVIQCGTNDAIQSIATSTTIFNISAICDMAKTNGIIPLVSGLPPLSGYSAKAAEINAALHADCYANSTIFVNPWNFINRGDNAFISGATISSDGTHPLIKHVLTAGGKVVTHLKSIGIFPVPCKSVYSNSADGGKFANATFYADTNADGISNNCVAVGAGGTFTRVPASKTFGFAQRCEFAGATDSSGIGTSTSGLTIGTSYFAVGKIRISVAAGYLRLSTFSNGGSNNSAIGGSYYPTYSVADGVIDLEYCEEFKATSTSVQTNFYCANGAASTFSIEIEQFQIFENPIQY